MIDSCKHLPQSFGSNLFNSLKLNAKKYNICFLMIRLRKTEETNVRFYCRKYFPILIKIKIVGKIVYRDIQLIEMEITVSTENFKPFMYRSK